MSTVASEISSRYVDVQVIKPKKPSFFKRYFDRLRFERAWDERNIESGTVFMDSLEIDYLEFEQDYFVAEDKDVIAKLKRIGFKVTESPDTKYDFITYYYNDKHNISIGIFKPVLRDVIYKADRVIHDSKIEGETARAVFISVVKTFGK